MVFKGMPKWDLNENNILKISKLILLDEIIFDKIKLYLKDFNRKRNNCDLELILDSISYKGFKEEFIHKLTNILKYFPSNLNLI